jgi:hypothetical protein
VERTAPVGKLPRNTGMKQRFGRGNAVRVRKYGTGHVMFATDEHVAVLFPDGTTRTFMARFVKPDLTWAALFVCHLCMRHSTPCSMARCVGSLARERRVIARKCLSASSRRYSLSMHFETSAGL